MVGPRSCADWLLAWIAEHPPGSRLPGQRELCRRFAIGKAALQQVLAPHLATGDLVVRPGAGVWRAGTGPSTTGDQAPTADAVAVFVARLRESLINDEWPMDQALPATRTLATAYGCSTRTVVAGLRVLQARGHLRRRGRATYPGIHRRERPVILYCGQTSWEDLLASPGLRQLLRSLETRLSAAGYLLRYATTGALRSLSASLRCSGSPAPHVVALDCGPPQQQELREALAASAYGSGPRRARLVQFGTPTPVLAGAVVCAWGSIPTQTARAIARFVVGHGLRGLTVAHHAVSGRHWVFDGLLRILPEVRRLQPGLPLRLVFQSTARSLHELLEWNDPGRRDWHLAILGKYEALTPADLDQVIERVPDLAAAVGQRGPEQCLVLADREDWRLLSQLGDRLRWWGPVLLLGNDSLALQHELASVQENWPRLAALIVQALDDDSDLPRTRRGFLQFPVQVVHRASSARRSPWEHHSS